MSWTGKRPRAILFDHDGVLVASEPLHWAAWRKLMAELGYPFNQELIQSYVGKTAPQILRALLDLYEPGWGGDPQRLQALVQRKNELYMEEAGHGLKPYPGILDGLKWLKDQGIRSAVVSNARRRELVAILENLGLAPFFEVIISREDVPAHKPDPTPYLMAAASLGCDPSECIAVEDSPPGLEAALLARIPAAAVTTNFPPEFLEYPVPGRPDLRPFWIGASAREFFRMVEGLKLDR